MISTIFLGIMFYLLYGYCVNIQTKYVIIEIIDEIKSQ